MADERKRKLVVSIASTMLSMASAAATASASAAAAVEQQTPRRKKQGRYRKQGGIPEQDQCHWHQVDCRGDELEFLHFTSLSQSSFNELVRLVGDELNATSLSEHASEKPSSWHLKRRNFFPTGGLLRCV